MTGELLCDRGNSFYLCFRVSLFSGSLGTKDYRAYDSSLCMTEDSPLKYHKKQCVTLRRHLSWRGVQL